MQDCMYSTTRQFFPWYNSRRFRLEWFTHVSQYGYGYQQRKHQQQFVKSSVVVKNEKHVYIVMMVHMLNMRICLLAGSPRMYSFSLLILSFLVDRQRRKLREKEKEQNKVGRNSLTLRLWLLCIWMPMPAYLLYCFDDDRGSVGGNGLPWCYVEWRDGGGGSSGGWLCSLL